MKKMSKLLSVFMALAMVVALMSTMAMAASVTEVGTYDALVKAVADGGEIKLTASIELPASIDIAAGKNVTIDLNGKTLSFASPAPQTTYLVKNNGTLTIKDSSEEQTGLMTTYAENPDIDWGTEGYPTYANNTISNYGTVTLLSGTLENTSPSGGASYVVDNYAGGTLNVEGGKIINENNYAVRMNTSSAAANTMNVNGGEIEGKRAIWIQLAGSDATVAPVVNLTVTDGALTSTGYQSSGYDYKEAVYSYSNGNDMKNVKISISGGIFTGDVALTGGKNKTNTETLTVTGGTFTGLYGDVYSYGDDEKAKETVNISGGKFTANPAAAYLASGYAVQKNGEYIEVVKAEDVQAPADVTVNTTVQVPETPKTETVSVQLGEGTTPEKEAAAAELTTAVSNGGGVAIESKDDNKAIEEAAEALVGENDANIGAAALDAAGKLNSGDTVSVRVETTMDIAVTDVVVDGSEVKSITVDITPMAQVIATTAAANETATVGTNAVALSEKQEIEVNGDVTISIPLPAGFATGTKITVIHNKEDGTTYAYEATVTGNVATFTNPNGFSEFVLVDNANTLQAAIDSAPAEGVVIDLGGKTVDTANNVEILDKKVTIKNGTINAATYWKVLGTSELTLEAVTFNSSSYGFNINDSSDGLDKSAKVTLGAGTKVISAKQSFRIYASGVLTVDGGEIECTGTAVAIAPNAGSTINLISGSIVGAGAAAIQGGGYTLNMTGGKLETKSSKGRAIVITYHTTIAELNGPVIMNISGGTIAGLIRSAVEASAERPITLNISGDAVIEGYNGKDIDTAYNNSITTANITGGTFSAEPDADFIVAGYKAFANSTDPVTYTVKVDPDAAEAKIGDVYYLTLEEALAAAIAGSGAEITVLKSAAIENALPDMAGKEITILGVDGGVTITANMADPTSVCDIFTVGAGGKLTLGANLTITSNTSILYAHSGGQIIVDGATLTGDNNVYTLAYAANSGSSIVVKAGSQIGATGTGALAVGDSAQATIEGGVIYTTGSDSPVWAGGNGTIEIKDGTVEARNTTQSVSAAFATSGGEVVVNGGTLSVMNSSHALIASVSGQGSGGKVTVNDGTVYGVKAWEASTSSASITGGNIIGHVGTEGGATMVITGGTFSQTPDSSYIEDGYDISEDGTVGVVRTVTINAIPSNATVEVKKGDAVVDAESDGSYKLFTGTYTYTVSKDGYESKSGEFTVSAENLEIPVELAQLYNVTFTIPDGASIVIKKDNQTVLSAATGKLTNGTYAYEVSKSGYTTDTGSFTVDNADFSKTVTLTEVPVVVTTYRAVVAETANGTVTLSRTRASRNSLITITATPDASYKVAKVEVTNFRGEAVDVTDAGNGTYTFRMPGSTTNVTVTFESTSSISHLTDVAADKWYYSAVEYAVSNGLMVGTAEDKFSPEAAMERAMVIQVLYNMENTPAVTYTGKFSDVADGKWYTNAIEWGMANGILVDYGTAFDPNGAISREEMVRMMYNYAQYKGKDTSARGDLSKYTDGATTSDWAVEYVKWAVGSGVMVGGETILNPTGNANRAEVAQIFKNFHEIYG